MMFEILNPGKTSCENKNRARAHGINLAKITRPLRWKIIKILSPGIWAKSHRPSFYPVGDVPRGSTLYAIEHFKDRKIIYCEVGVHLGENSKNVIQMLNVENAFLIDMYEEYETDFGGHSVLVFQHIQDNNLKNAREKLDPFKDRITWILKYSDKAIEDLPDDIDFIYIDANHEYEYVKGDIDRYWEKVGENGILGGHDFFGKYNGVITAVFEFAVKNNLRIYSDLYDWWFIK